MFSTILYNPPKNLHACFIQYPLSVTLCFIYLILLHKEEQSGETVDGPFTVVCILVLMKSEETIHSTEKNDTSYESLWSF